MPAIGVGYKNLLSYGMYDLDGTSPDYTTRERLFKQGTVSADLKAAKLDTNKITEHVRHSWYEDATSQRHPSQGDTRPQYGKKDAYTWTKAPRYDGRVYEVGPLARVAVTYAKGDPTMKKLVDGALKQLKAPPSALFSVLGRHLARALSAKFIADSLEGWALSLKPGQPAYVEYEMPEQAMGMGIVEGSRGALGHWIEIKGKKIANYQAVVPPPGTCPRWMTKASTAPSSRRSSAPGSRTRKTPLKSCASSALSTPASPAPSTW